jgi:hypothetical protein
VCARQHGTPLVPQGVCCWKLSEDRPQVVAVLMLWNRVIREEPCWERGRSRCGGDVEGGLAELVGQTGKHAMIGRQIQTRA